MTKRPIMDSKILDLVQRTNEKMQSFVGGRNHRRENV